MEELQVPWDPQLPLAKAQSPESLGKTVFREPKGPPLSHFPGQLSPRPWNWQVEARPEALEDKQTREVKGGPLTMWGKSGGGGLQRRSPWRRVTTRSQRQAPPGAQPANGQEEDVQHVLQEVLFPTGPDAAHEVYRRGAVQVPDLKVDLFLEAQPCECATRGSTRRPTTEHHNKDQ